MDLYSFSRFEPSTTLGKDDGSDVDDICVDVVGTLDDLVSVTVDVVDFSSFASFASFPSCFDLSLDNSVVILSLCSLSILDSSSDDSNIKSFFFCGVVILYIMNIIYILVTLYLYLRLTVFSLNYMV